MRVEYDDPALADLDAIVSAGSADAPRAAGRMRERLLTACERLPGSPRRGRPSPRDRLRELTTIRPHVIVYSVGEDVVRIRRIVHGARLR